MAALQYGKNTDLSTVDYSFDITAAEGYPNRFVDAGDVNGDGYHDLIVGSQGFNSCTGKIWIIFGKASGWGKKMNISLSASASYYGERSWDCLGSAVATVGDVNGDGFDDFIVTANGNDAYTVPGRVYLVLGKATGWSKDVDISNADASFVGENLNSSTGVRIAGLGDVNGDGYDDFGIGAPGTDKVYIIFGKATGWAMDTKLKDVPVSFLGQETPPYFDAAVAGAGDINGDGFDDIIIGDSYYGANLNGAVYIIFGKSSGWQKGLSLANADASFIGSNFNWLGYAVHGAGDVNGDGFDDFLMSNCNGTDADATLLVLGKAGNWAKNMNLNKADAYFYTGSVPYYSEMQLIAGGGDLNGDGLDDFAFQYLDGVDYHTYVVLGKTLNWNKKTNVSTIGTSFITGVYMGYRYSIDIAKDIDGDGIDELLIAQGNGLYIIRLQAANKPTSINSIKVFSDATYTQEITNVAVGDQIFIELHGTDSSPTTADITKVKVNSTIAKVGFTMNLYETGTNTGIFRGNFTIKDRVNEHTHWINATNGNTITVTSLQNSNIKATIMVGGLFLYPLQDQSTAQEDVLYNSHYYTTGWANIIWNFNTNAPWLKWDSTAQNLTGKPTNANVGTSWVKLSVAKGADNHDEHDFNIIVQNQPPKILTSSVTQVLEDHPYRMDYNSSDDGQGAITWHLTTNAKWLSINSKTGILLGTPSNDNVGQTLVKVSVDDGNGGWAWSNFTLNVINTNDPPVINTLDKIVAVQDVRYSVHYNATDIDTGDALSWSLKTNASWLTLDSQTVTLVGIPRNADVGSYYVNITVTDLSGAISFHNFTLIVQNVNDPPIWTDVPPNSTIDDRSSFTFDVNGTDIDRMDHIVYTISTVPSSDASIDSGTGIIHWSPKGTNTYQVTLSASDGQITINYTFSLVVTHYIPNNLPETTLLSPSNSTTLNTLVPRLKWTMYDKDSDPISVEIFLSNNLQDVKTHSSSASIVKGLTKNQYDITKPIQKGSTYYWTVIPNDGKDQGICNSGIFTFKTSQNAHVNHPPTINAIGDQKATVGKKFTLQVSAHDPDPEDAGHLTYAINNAPEGMTIAPSTGFITWKPSNDQIGPQSVKVNVSDGTDSVERIFNIEVVKASNQSGLGASMGLMIAGLLVAVICVIAVILVLMRKRKRPSKTPEVAQNQEPPPPQFYSAPPQTAPIIQQDQQPIADQYDPYKYDQQAQYEQSSYPIQYQGNDQGSWTDTNQRPP